MEIAVKKFVTYLEVLRDEICKEIMGLYRFVSRSGALVENELTEQVLTYVSGLEGVSLDLPKIVNQKTKEVYDNHVLAALKKMLCLNKKRVVLNNLIRILETPELEWVINRELFNDFEKLNEYLLSSPLENVDRMNVIFSLIKKNLAGTLEEAVVVLDPEKADEYQFDGFTSEQVRELVCTYALDDLDEVQQMNIIEKLTVDASNIIEQHRIIKEHYFEKEDTYQDDDIVHVRGALEKLRVSPNLCEIIASILMRKLRKRNKNIMVPIQFEKQSQDKKESLSGKEYHKIYKEIRSYFDIEGKKLVRPVTWDEAFNVASLLLKLGESEDVVQSFFKVVELENRRQFSNPIAIYNITYPRLQYYKNECGLEESLHNLDLYLQEMLLVSNEDYVVWKEMFTDEFEAVLLEVPKNFQYEHEKAQQLLKNK